jgi:nucleotide-binding universal stress UspA family protein
MPTDDQVESQSDRREIVVGVDGSEHSRVALKWASDEAKRHGSTLRILHAQLSDHENVPNWYEPGSSALSAGQAVVDDAFGLVATRHPSVAAHAEVVEWPPSLVLTIASRSAELLVVGARGKGGFEELRLGSVSDQCIQYAHCPVAVVHGDPDLTPRRAVEPRIVVGIDGSLGSTRALRWALEEARIRSASVEAIYAWQYPPIGTFVLGPRQGFKTAVREIIDAATEDAQKWAPEVPIEVVDRFEATVPALLDASEGAELLVTGSRGHGGFSDALLGSVAHQCARHAKCAVVIARPHIVEEHAGGAEKVVQMHRTVEPSTGDDRPADSAASGLGGPGAQRGFDLV